MGKPIFANLASTLQSETTALSNVVFLQIKTDFQTLTPKIAQILQDLVLPSVNQKAKTQVFQHPFRAILYETEYGRWFEIQKKELQSVMGKWGSFFNYMPACVYQIINHTPDAFRALKEFADLEYGNKIGIVDFFILPDPKRQKIPLQYRKPIITSTEQISNYMINAKNVETELFLCAESLETLAHTNQEEVIQHIRWGERQQTKTKGHHTKKGVSFPQVQSVRNHRPYWYSFHSKTPGDFVIPLLIREKFVIAGNPEKLLDSNMFYHGFFKDPRYTSPRGKLAGLGLLNSTITYLFLEVFGRHNIPGRFNIYGTDLEAMYIPNFQRFSDAMIENLADAFSTLSRGLVREIKYELGIDNKMDPRLQKLQILPERRQLDEIIFSALGISEILQQEIYYAFAELIFNRLTKEKSESKVITQKR